MEAALDAAYAERNALVAALARHYPSGTSATVIPGWDKRWHGCVYIDTPQGQMSWHFHERDWPMFMHLPRYEKPWDGHTTEEKYKRLKSLKCECRYGSHGDTCVKCGKGAY